METEPKFCETLDVLIVGTGISGLTAAYTILNKDESVTLAVIEGKDRIGGRTVEQELKTANGTDTWDLGGQWIGSCQPHIMKLIEQLELQVYKQYTEGKKVMQLGSNNVSTYSGGIPSLKIHSLIDLHLFMQKVERLRKKIPMFDPSQCPHTEKWDSITLQQAMDMWLWTKGAKDAVSSAGRCMFGVEPCDMSLMYYLMYSQAAGGIEPLISAEENMGQEFRIQGGAFQVCKKLAAKIGTDKIHLNQPACRIVQKDRNIFVHTTAGKCYKCERVIIAVPPQQAAKIDYTPCLPVEKTYVFQRMPAGYITKIIVTYKKAFWREKGYSGEFVTNGGPPSFGGCKTGPLNIGYDATTSGGNPALVTFIGGAQHIEYSELQPQVRRQSVLHSLAEFFGQEAWDYIDYCERNWSEEQYSGGGPVSVATPGVISRIAPGLRYPFKRIHFAGTESATVWCGFMNGAVQAGQRAAHEVLYNLRPNSVSGKDMEDTFYNMNQRRTRNSSQCLEAPPRNFAMYRLIIPAAAVAVTVVVVRKMLLTLAWH